MALNKARTSIWVKTLIIILIIAFVSLFMYQGIAGIIELFKQPAATTQTQTADPVAALQAQNQPTVDALRQVAESNPASYTAQVALANQLYNWANELSQPASGQSQLTTASMTAAFAKWGEARAAYDAAAKLMKTYDPAVQTDRSYATFQSGEATPALTIVTEVTKKAPKFSQAWAHIGVYMEALGQQQRAIEAFNKYLKLDPKGANAESIRAHLKQLAGSSSTMPSGIGTKTP